MIKVWLYFFQYLSCCLHYYKYCITNTAYYKYKLHCYIQGAADLGLRGSGCTWKRKAVHKQGSAALALVTYSMLWERLWDLHL